MKTLLSAFLSMLILSAVLFACSEEAKEGNDSTETTDVNALPVLQFEETEFDFDTINAGDVVEHTFTFKNTGDAPLVITDARTQCGCTVPEYPKGKAIEPGDSGEIKVIFDSTGKMHRQLKKVTLFANTNPQTSELTITGFVNPSEESIKNQIKTQ